MMKNRKKEERAISPVISTILLIMVVIIIATIIILWGRGFIKEVIIKEVNGESKVVEQYCSEVRMKPILNGDGTFGFTNEGSVSIFGVRLKLTKDGNANICEIKDQAVEGGFSKMIEIGDLASCPTGTYIRDPAQDPKRSDYDEVKIIPILLGKRKSGALEPYDCPEKDGIDI